MKLRRIPKLLIRLALIAVLLAVAGIVLLLIDGLRDELRTADCALVLGSKVETNGNPSARLKARLDRAAELYKQGYFPWIIVSGGIGKEGFDEAVVMRDYLVNQGIPSDRIILDNQGVTTWESARNTKSIFAERGFKSVMIVTQYFHIPRSRLALHKFGISDTGSAHARIFEWRDLYSTIREAAGYPAYLFRST